MLLRFFSLNLQLVLHRTMFIKRITQPLHLFFKKRIDSIQNERLRKSILQAIPFWIGSIITGFFAVFYAKLFYWAEQLLAYFLAEKAWSIFILSPLCFVLSWWLINKFAKYAKGSGIPQVMASVELANPKEYKIIQHFLSIKIVFIKILSSLVLILGGGAIGREGPTIQISASVFRQVYLFLPQWWPKVSQKNMIMTGAAAGLSAAFNTPLGGMVFAVEELTKTHINYFKTALFTAVIIAGLTAQSLAGSYLYLGYPKTQNVTLFILFPVIVVAGISGILASLLSGFIVNINQWKKKNLKNNITQIIYLIMSSLFIASIAYFIHHGILGSGKENMEQLLFHKDKEQHWYMPLFRVIGVALSFTSGGAGGIFAPALSAGASIGGVFASLANLTNNESNVVILAGMVAFLTGITRAPFTSAILVLEMTDRHSLIFHLMLASIVSSVVSIIVNQHSLYDILKINYLYEVRQKSIHDKNNESF